MLQPKSWSQPAAKFHALVSWHLLQIAPTCLVAFKGYKLARLAIFILGALHQPTHLPKDVGCVKCNDCREVRVPDSWASYADEEYFIHAKTAGLLPFVRQALLTWTPVVWSAPPMNKDPPINLEILEAWYPGALGLASPGLLSKGAYSGDLYAESGWAGQIIAKVFTRVKHQFWIRDSFDFDGPETEKGIHRRFDFN